MVLTAGQTTAFFENDDQMGLGHLTTIDSLQQEGIDSVDSLAEWRDDDWDQWAKNCKRPDKIADAANPGALVDQVPFPLSVKSL